MIVRALCWLAALLGFGAGVDDISAESRDLAMRQWRGTVIFAFFPLIIAMLATLYVDQSIMAFPDALLAIVKSGEVYSISVALLAPIWFALRSESELPNKDSFHTWVIVVLVLSSIALVLQHVPVGVRSIAYVAGAVAVLIITFALFYASAAFQSEVSEGSVRPAMEAESSFTSEFAKSIGYDDNDKH